MFFFFFFLFFEIVEPLNAPRTCIFSFIIKFEKFKLFDFPVPDFFHYFISRQQSALLLLLEWNYG